MSSSDSEQEATAGLAMPKFGSAAQPDSDDDERADQETGVEADADEEEEEADSGLLSADAVFDEDTAGGVDGVDLDLQIDVCDQANNIADVPALQASSAYPNPANTTVNIDFNVTASPVHLQLFDLVGNVAKDVTLEAAQGTAKLDVSDLNNGVYLYNLEVNGYRSEVKSLVVSH